MFELKNLSCFDYLTEIDDESISLVLIDPPYEISRDTNFKKGNGLERLKVSMDFGEWDKEFEGLSKVIEESYRVLKKGGTLICFYDIWKITHLRKYFEDSKFKQIRLIEWLKTNPVPLNSKRNYLTNAREIAILGVKGSNPIFNSVYDAGIYKYSICRDVGRFHPTQKPIALIKEIIEKHSNENDVVLDCFSGSGTTAAACLELGRDFKGCEISEEYYLKSLDRLHKIEEKLNNVVK